MIIFEGVTAVAGSKKKNGIKTVLADVDLIIPTDRHIAVIGTQREEAGMLMRLLAGLATPRTGRIIRRAKVSFPIGYMGSVRPELSVRQNVAHLCRLYDADEKAIIEFVRKSARLGPAFSKPYAALSTEVQQSLAEIVGFAIPFDVYLLKELKAASDRSVAYELFEARRRTAGTIVFTTNKAYAAEHCDMAIVLANRSLRLYDSIEKAFESVEAIDADRAGVRNRRRLRRQAGAA